MADLAAETEPEPGPCRDLVAELRGRDGRTRTVRVPYPAAAEGEAAQLRGLRAALSELQERVVELLAPLVQEERAAAGGARRGEWRGGTRRGGSAGPGAPPAPRTVHPRPPQLRQVLAGMTTTTTTMTRRRMKAKTKTTWTRQRAAMTLP